MSLLRRLPGFGRGPSRDTVREHARRLLTADGLSSDERDRVAHLLTWLERPEPRGEFPGRQTGILDTARREIGQLWTRVHGTPPW